MYRIRLTNHKCIVYMDGILKIKLGLFVVIILVLCPIWQYDFTPLKRLPFSHIIKWDVPCWHDSSTSWAIPRVLVPSTLPYTKEIEFDKGKHYLTPLILYGIIRFHLIYFTGTRCKYPDTSQVDFCTDATRRDVGARLLKVSVRH